MGALKLQTTFPPSSSGIRRLYRLSYSSSPDEGQAFLHKEGGRVSLHFGSPVRQVELSSDFSYLQEDDVVRINETAGELRVLYRKSSNHNVLFFTERCNSRCIMCSQPPRDINDDWLVDEILDLISLISPDTRTLGISGGEPTLLFPRLIEVLTSLRLNLPQTAVHMLTNGRLFSHLKHAERLSNAMPSAFMLGIPLYSDVPSLHNFVVQARNAFDETVLGITNLARVGVPIEIRVVLHKATISRLPMLAQFLARNMPFVRQVALMGMEPIGFAKSNFNALWIEPWEYQEEVALAVRHLSEKQIPVSIYNIPLCQITETVRHHAARSISDWKNIYFPTCHSCSAKEQCCGFFAWAQESHFPHLQPFNS